MEFKQIQELIKLVNKTNIAEFKMDDGNIKLTIRTKSYVDSSNNAAQQQLIPIAAPIHQQVMQAPVVETENKASNSPSIIKAPEAKEDDGLIEVRSPMVGTFYRSSGPEKPPFIKVGDSIEVGSTVCIVEAMKLFNEIESEVSGKIVKVLVEDASPVEYDQVLFLVEPA